MAVTLLGGGNGHVSATDADDVQATTGAVDSTGATLIVLAASWYFDRGTMTFSDSKSNSYTSLTKQFNDRSTCIIAYKNNPTVGSGHTFTATCAVGETGFPNIFAYIATGNDLTTPFFSQAGSGTDGGGVTSKQPGTVTPLVNGALIVTVISVCLTTTATAIDSSFNLSTGYDNESGGRAAYLEQSTAAAVNPSWSGFSSNLGVATRIAVFKPAASAAGNPWNYYAQQRKITRLWKKNNSGLLIPEYSY